MKSILANLFQNNNLRRRRASRGSLVSAEVQQLEDRQLLAADFGGTLLEATLKQSYSDKTDASKELSSLTEADKIPTKTDQLTVVGRPSIVDQLYLLTERPATLNYGLLKVNGTYLDDKIVIEDNGQGKVVVSLALRSNPQTVLYEEEFSANSINSIEVWGGRGDDRVDNNTDISSVINGEGGDDTIFGGSAKDTIRGGDGEDEIHGAGGNDVLLGNGDNDTIFGDRLTDPRTASNVGNDVIVGGDGDDVLFGDGGTDWIYGDGDNDSLFGGDGDDYLNGGDGDDTLSGGLNDDRLYGYDGDDELAGGEDDDILNGGDDDDILEGDGGNDTLYGGRDNDTLKGGAGDDTLKAGAGDDVLFGGTENDALFGESGNDGLFGGPGQDEVTGGANVDRFLVITSSSGVMSDGVKDMETQDVIVRFENGATTGTTWTEAQVEAVDSAFAILVQATGNTALLETATGGDLTFHLMDDDKEPTGLNSGNGNIKLNTNLFSASSRFSVPQVVYHEIGHCWQNSSPFSGEFMALSGWTTIVWPWDTNSYVQADDGWWRFEDASFVSEYGEQEPHEDFAEVFSYYFMNLAGEPFVPNQPGGYLADANALADKLENIDKLVDWLV